MSNKKNNKVNLFVVGAMKAGTTSFVDILSAHPDIYVPTIKEPNYFVDILPDTIYNPSRFFDLEVYFKEKFPEPLHIAKLTNLIEYKKAYSLSGNESYRVDASTVYLHASEAASYIHAYNPKAKIIVILRNPLKRAFSHYNMNLAKGRENKSFSDVITENIAEYHSGSIEPYSYLAMSMYDKAVKKYKDNFQDVLILYFEDILNNEHNVSKLLASFLDIKAFPVSSNEHKNKTRSLRFQKLFYLLKRIGLKDYFSLIVPKKLKQKLFLALSTEKNQKMGLDDNTISELDEIFRKESSLC